jgi:hypothetical protein
VNDNKLDTANDRFAERSSQALDRSLEEMDGATLSRLNQIRQAALSDTAASRLSGWLPAGAAATACMLVLAVNFSLRESVDPITIESPLGDLDLLSSNEDLEMLEELEFYAWLETEMEGS